MDAFDPANVDLPRFLDPVLNYLQSNLPAPVFDVFLKFSSNLLALVSLLISLVKYVIHLRPWEWDSTILIPMIIGIFSAYLALLSLWRTTSWMIRTGFWMAKWATILSALMTGAGYIAGGGDIGNGLRNAGAAQGLGNLASTLGGFILQSLNANNGPRTRNSRPTRDRPGAWESFERHDEWKREQDEINHTDDDQNDLQRMFGEILGAASEAASNGRWWDIAKGFVDSQLSPNNGRQDDGSSSEGATTSKTRSRNKAGADGKASKSKNSKTR